MSDTFSSMSVLLSKVEQQGNYRFRIRRSGNSQIKLFAPHGGCIEPGTARIVEEIAGMRLDYFIFEGLRKAGRCKKLLHVTSTHYNEKTCQSMVREALLAVSIHGCKGRGVSKIEVGGGNKTLITDLLKTLKPIYPAIRAPLWRNGSRPQNFINGQGKQGVQLELTEGFRRNLFLDYPRERKPNPQTFPRFISILREWLGRTDRELREQARRKSP